MGPVFVLLAVFAALLPTNVAHADITTGLVSNWKFDEGSGTTAADSGSNGYTGTLGGDLPQWVGGKIGPYALGFTGDSGSHNSYVSLASNPIPNFSSANTVCAWVYNRNINYSSNYGQTFLALSDGGNGNLRFGQDGNGNMFVNYNDAGGTNYTFGGTADALTNNTWAHVCSVFNGSNVLIYFNGTALAGGALTGYSSADTNTIGSFDTSPNDGNWPGYIDDVRVYDRALSSSDITELYNYRPGGPQVSVQAASSTTANSATLNGNITSIGSSTVTTEGFYYGKTQSYGSDVSSSGSFGTGPFSLGISNLSCATTYHYQAFATNGNGSAVSPDQTFTTGVCSTITAGLYGYWSLDDGSGLTATDVSGYGNNGTLLGSTTPSWIAGYVGSNALSFDGASSYVGNMTPGFNPGSETLSFWVKRTGNGTQTGNFQEGVVLFGGDGSNSSAEWGINWFSYNPNQYAFNQEEGDGSGRTDFTVSVGDSTQWHYLAITEDSTSGLESFYVDGVLAATSTIAGGSYLTSGDSSYVGQYNRLTFGRFWDQFNGPNYFQGDIDDVRIYNTALSAQDVAQLYTYRPGTPSVSAQAASSITAASAALNGSIDSIGSSTPTTEGFYWGTDSSYGFTVSTNGSFATGPYSLELTNISCNTAYHYQAFATNANGTGVSSDDTFTTNACVMAPPTLAAPSVSSIGSTTVTFNSSIISNNLASSTVEGFNYGLTTSYGSTASTSGTFGTGSYSIPATGLSCGATYHYQAFAINSAGTGTSTDATFSTAECTLFQPRGDINSSIVSITDINGGANVTSALTDNSTSTSATFSWSSSTNPGMLIDFGTTTSIDRIFFTGTSTQNLGSDGYANWQYPANSNTLPLGRIVVWVGNGTSTSSMTRAGEFMVPYDQGSPLDLEGNVQFSPLQGRYVMLELETAVNWYPYWSGWSNSTTTASTTLSWKVSDLEAYGFTGSNVYTKEDAVVLPSNAARALTAAASDLSYYLGQLEGEPVPIVISNSTSTVLGQYPGTVYDIEDLASLAPDWNTMVTNQNNGSLPTEVNVEKHGREVDFRAWPYRNVTESVWEFLKKEGVIWSYPDAHGEYIPSSGVNLSFLPLTFVQTTTQANWNANAMQPWAEWVTQTLRPDYLYVWRNGYNLSENYPGFLYGDNEVPQQPSTGVSLSSDYTEEFAGYPHNFNAVLPSRILAVNPTWCGFVISSGTRVCPPTSGAPVFDMSNSSVINWVAGKMAAVEASFPLDQNSTNIDYTTNAFYLLPEDAVTYDQSTSSNLLNLPAQPQSIPYVKQYGTSQSGAFYNFVNQIALQVASSSPNVTIGALNYADLFLPPPNIPSFPSNVRIDLTQYGSPNLPMSSPVNAAFKQVEDLWHVKASQLGNYDYVLLQTDHWQPESQMPRPLVAGIVSRAQYLNSIGALTGSTQAYTDSFPYNPWNFYAYTRSHGNPSLTENQILNEFFTAYFNEASSSMLAYYNDMENWQVANNVDLHLQGYADGITPGSFPRAVLAKMQTDLENAEAQAQYWVTKQRVWYIRQGFNYLIGSLGLDGVDLNDTSSYTQVGQNSNPVTLNLQNPFALIQGPQGNDTATTSFSGSPGWQFFSGGGSLSIPVNFNQAGTYTITINAKDPLDSSPQPLYVYAGPQNLGYAIITTGNALNYTFTANIPSNFGVQDITLSNATQQSSANVYSIIVKLQSYTASVPTVTVQAPTSIGTSSVIFNGNITASGTASIVAEGFSFGDTVYYGLEVSPSSTSTDGTFPPGPFSATATGLNCGSTYHYQAFAQNSLGTATSSDGTVNTLACPSLGLPVLTTSAPNLVSTSTLTLNANISSIGSSSVTQSGFAYGTSSTLTGASVSTSTLGGQSAGNFSQGLTGLVPNTTYYFEAYAVNSFGTSTGSILSTTTLPVIITTPGAPTSVTAATSTPNQATVTWTAPASNGGSPILFYTLISNPSVFSATTTNTSLIATGLANGTSYSFTVSATNATGTGATSTPSNSVIPTGFTPTLSVTASTTSYTSATLTGIMTADGAASSTVRGFKYGLTSGYGLSTSTAGTYGVGSYTMSLSGLIAGTTYHFQAFATNSAGTGVSADATFTTHATVPTVSASAASALSQTAATLNGSLILDGLASSTVQGFEYGTNTSYGTVLSATSTGFVLGSFSNALTNLSCGTTYHFRSFATNSYGTASSTDQSFATSACPSSGGGNISISSGGGGGSISPSALANILAPSPLTTAYLKSLNPPLLPIASSILPTFTLNLALGSTGSQVTALQNILSTLGFLKVPTTGYFGSLTESALKEYQSSKGISPVGYVGPSTRAALNGQSVNAAIPVASTTPAFQFIRNLTLGSTGADVKALQQFLNSHGYTIATKGPGSPGNETLIFGNATKAALARFQKANGISPAVGYFGPDTRGAVNDILK